MTTFAVDFQTATEALLNAYKNSVGLSLQTYPARPRSVYAPSAWEDLRTDTIDYTGSDSLMQHTAHIQIVVLHGLFDSKEAVTQRNAFVDGFVTWVRTNRHQAGPRTIISAMQVTDEPNYVPDWLPIEEQRQYFATRITLEGYVED